MAIYEFKCDDCGRIMTVSIPITSADKKRVKCDNCKSIKTRKIISKSTFVLKGGGWYADGYTKNKR